MTQEGFEMDDELWQEVRGLVGKDPANVAKFQEELRGEMAEATRRAARRVAQQGQDALMQQYQADLAKVRRGDVDAIYRLKAQYQQRGLKV